MCAACDHLRCRGPLLPVGLHTAAHIQRFMHGSPPANPHNPPPQERKSIPKAGLAVHRLRGEALRPAHWDRFYEFYLRCGGGEGEGDMGLEGHAQ